LARTSRRIQGTVAPSDNRVGEKFLKRFWRTVSRVRRGWPNVPLLYSPPALSGLNNRIQNYPYTFYWFCPSQIPSAQVRTREWDTL
jgi:hypothetical protein